MENETQTLLIRGVPKDVVDYMERRASLNFRSRHSEIIAILTSVARFDVKLPSIAVGEVADQAVEPVAVEGSESQAVAS